MFLHCMFEIIIGVQNMHPIEIAYVNKKHVESNIQKLNRIKRELEHTQNHSA